MVNSGMMTKNTESGQRVTITIEPAAAGERLDRALATALALQTAASPAEAPSRSRIKALIAEGHVTSDGATISDPSRRVKPGQIFALTLPETVPLAAAPQEIPLQVLYEDEYLIVIDKPAGLVVHPAPGNPDRTLVNALLAHCGNSLSGIGGVGRPGIVHRLDKDTSGLLVAAKTDAAHRGLAAQFAAHGVERAYAAVVWGIPRPREGEITGAIGRSPRDRKKMAIVRGGRGKAALTRYRVLRPLASGHASLVECRLATGRTHQIRVHLASAGHPLLGDPVYGRGGRRGVPAEVLAIAQEFPRQALDAFSLGFEHPVSHKPLRFQRDYDKDLSGLMAKLELI